MLWAVGSDTANVASPEWIGLDGQLNPVGIVNQACSPCNCSEEIWGIPTGPSATGANGFNWCDNEDP